MAQAGPIVKHVPIIQKPKYSKNLFNDPFTKGKNSLSLALVIIICRLSFTNLFSLQQLFKLRSII